MELNNEIVEIKQKDWKYLTSDNSSKDHSETAIKSVMRLRYNREEAINILNGLNPDGSKIEFCF